MVSSLLHAAFLGLAAAPVAASSPPAPTVVAHGDVTYRGTTTGTVEHFLNIRFAHDTSGPRRFAPPEPYTPPAGSEVDATRPGPACAQTQGGLPPFFDATPDISEDCLTVRIARPAGTAPGARLPVVVHVVEGGVIKGWAYDPHADPEPLVALAAELGKPVMYVALQSRLTMFGFARLPLLRDRQSLNAGMRDQRAGMEWVRDNIAAFGGDPQRITAWGLSAAGTMTALQLVAYGGCKGVPFTQVWTMSGPPGTALNMSSDATEAHTRAVAEKLGCAHGGDESTLACLRQLPMEQLLDAAVAYSVENHPPMGLFTFIPSVDGDFFPDRTSTLYRSGRFAKGIPTVLSWTHDDGATQAGPASMFQSEDDMKSRIQAFAHALTDDDHAELFALYAAADFAPEAAAYASSKQASDPDVPIHWFRISRLLRDLLFTCSSLDLGHEMARQSPVSDWVRTYSLNQTMLTPLFRAAGMPYLGTPHGSDMNYVMAGVAPEIPDVSAADAQLARDMVGAFAQFAYTGSPETAGGESGLGAWPPAFPGAKEGEELASVVVQVVGGPLGTGPALVQHAGDGHERVPDDDGMQVPLAGGIEFGDVSAVRRRELGRQKLFQRCAFINSLAEKLGH
ncbi:Alpha/Beta hydrolase protein [Lasiosphaeria miniovina]|uniref:Alpha/Beta hydrolase protein n=1 Tax=Lasiosphaeria miniovina TaxID=1954250 RepID=A0AA40ADV6_9PEZI|nr:Alpha/Beta hydrolase protein [Lasiosphaeria miniovina]KAK0714038.1 Alpha/Beta hydrolase protein [Lasiosphaeria miniovina]